MSFVSITGRSKDEGGKGSDKPPLISKYAEVPVGEIKPKGWLLRQLQIMNKGTTGHLDEVYAKVKDDNGWLGGKGDGWEETPYWLDGAVPLAYLLDDKQLQEKVLKYINWTLDNQRPSGYFGPITKWERETGKKITVSDCDKGEDWWPKMVMLKVLQQYYAATNDKRVIPFMMKYFDYQSKTLNKCRIGKWTEWAEARGMDNMMILHWLYNITGDKFLLDLSARIQQQTFAWSEWMGNRDWVISAAAYQNDNKWMRRHGVNVGMGLKHPAIAYQRTQDKKYLNQLRTGFRDLMTLHGLPFGVFSADEDLHGNDPTQGTELCAIVEAQFSLEQIIAITGDPSYADALERMTFNALPTQTTDDYNNKQYYQIANQVQISKGVFDFSLPFWREMNNVLGMRSGYTCCLANMHQGWTKFVTHLWYKTPDNGLAAMAYGPSEITTQVGNSNSTVTINQVTNYPFDDRIIFEFDTDKDVQFPLQLRIPAWCDEGIVELNGQQFGKEKGGKIFTINRTWKKGDKISLHLPMKITTSMWGRNSRAVERGPLVYALKIGEKWEKGHDEVEGDYFSVYPANDWNYGLLKSAVDTPGVNIAVSMVKPVADDFIWNLAHAPIELTVEAKKIPGWKNVNGIASQPVTDRFGVFRGAVDFNVNKITLVPYGCTKVRIVAFPVVQ
jgi:DUF1680 family protein